MSVGSSAEEEKVGSSRLERSNVARREEQRKIVLPLWHWRFAYNRPRANSTDTGASHFRCGLVICTMRGITRRTARETNYRGTRGTVVREISSAMAMSSAAVPNPTLHLCAMKRQLHG